MGKRSKSCGTGSGDSVVVKSKRVKNIKRKFEDNYKNDESKPNESITIPKERQVKITKKSQTIKGDAKKNKKNIFNDDDDDNEPIKEENPVELNQETEENIKDEDIDKFCDELTEEDNEQYESWVKLIEAKLYSNKNKPK